MSVTVYTSSTCSYCPMLKKYLSHFGVEFEEKSIEDPANAETAIKLSGAMTVPITLIDDSVVIGYNPAKLSSLLKAS